MTSGGWSRVDDDPDPGRMILGLDRLAQDPFFLRLHHRLLDLLEVRPGETAIDVGCGTGEAAAALAAAGADPTLGIDRSRRMVEEARRRHPSLRLLVGEARQLPVASGSAHRLLASRVLHHLSGAEEALAEWRRVLRPGGRVVTADSDPGTTTVEGVPEAAATAVVAWRAGMRPGGRVVEHLAERLVEAGFGSVRVEGCLLEVVGLDRADGVMGLADWGELAGAAGALDPDAARRWRGWVEQSAAAGRLRFRCRYMVGSAVAV